MGAQRGHGVQQQQQAQIKLMTEQTPACLFSFISAPFHSPLSVALADFNKFSKALMFLLLIFPTDRDAAHIQIMDLNMETHSNPSVLTERRMKSAFCGS